MSNYKKNHEMLTTYWTGIEKHNVEYSCLEVFFATAVLYENLSVEWENNNWEIEELKYVTLALDCLCEELSPNKYVGKETEYISVLKEFYKNERS